MPKPNDVIQLLENGDWEAAHSIVQSENSTFGSWAHGITHLIEGDAKNAKYWYTRACRAFPQDVDVQSEIQALKKLVL